MKHYYAIRFTSFSVNDSDEKIKEWKTASVYRFDTKAERDAFCAGEQYRRAISAKRAKYIGYIDSDGSWEE